MITEVSRCQPAIAGDIKAIEKTCRCCGYSKSLDEFHLNKSKNDGRDTQCKRCVNDRKKNKRRRKLERENIELNITFVESKKFSTAMDGVLELICKEMIESCSMFVEVTKDA